MKQIIATETFPFADSKNKTKENKNENKNETTIKYGMEHLDFKNSTGTTLSSWFIINTTLIETKARTTETI